MTLKTVLPPRSRYIKASKLSSSRACWLSCFKHKKSPQGGPAGCVFGGIPLGAMFVVVEGHNVFGFCKEQPAACKETHKMQD